MVYQKSHSHLCVFKYANRHKRHLEFFFHSWDKTYEIFADSFSKLIEFFSWCFKISSTISYFRFSLCSLNSHWSQIIHLKYNFLRALPTSPLSPASVTCLTMICFTEPTASASPHPSKSVMHVYVTITWWIKWQFSLVPGSPPLLFILAFPLSLYAYPTISILVSTY